MTKNKAKELSYDLFFTLMIFAKGIGLDSGDRIYYILSGAACLCVGCKLILTKYKIHEAAAMVLLCAIAFAAYRNSGRMGIVLSVLAIIGLKDMNVKRLFKLGAAVYGCSFAFTVIAAKIGLIGNPLAVHEKGGTEFIRWGMGYSTGNVFHISYFMLAVLLCYTWGKRYDWKRLLGLMTGNLLVYLYSLSYTGIVVTAFYLLLNLYAVKRKRLSIAEKIICQLPLPLCLLFSFGAPFLLQYPVVQKLDGILQARLTFSAYYLQNQPITLWGTRMKDVPNFWVIMDNGYVYFLMTFGAAAFVLFCAGYAALIGRYSGVGKCFGMRRKGKEEVRKKEQEERMMELAIIFSFLLYGIMEQFISNAFMNFSLLFMGEVLYGAVGEEGAEYAEKIGMVRSIKIIQWAGGGRRKAADGKIQFFCGLLCSIIGIGIFAVHFFAVPGKEYIPVPVQSLNYVLSQSVQIYAVNEEGTKEGLKGKMKAYREALESADIVNTAILEVGIEDRIAVEELTAAMEYSLPIYVQSSGNYDTFRIRLLELYYDITQEEYSALLDRMIVFVQETEGGQYSVKDGIYGERVGKSFGEDRIEHMNSDKGYAVEKVGSIVKMEHIRDSVFYAVLGMLAMLAVCKVRNYI